MREIDNFNSNNLIESKLILFTEICEFIAKLPKLNETKTRIVIITAGPEDAYICEYDFQLKKVTFKANSKPIILEDSLIIDTNGAGDAFAGGFLANYIKGNNLSICMEEGHKAASQIVKVRGCDISY